MGTFFKTNNLYLILSFVRFFLILLTLDNYLLILMFSTLRKHFIKRDPGKPGSVDRGKGPLFKINFRRVVLDEVRF